jgi:16S rRNA (cytosine1402-N4)-methyltransferase
VVDATLGLGGHSKEILARLPRGSTLVGFDRDSANLDAAQKRLESEMGSVIRENGLTARFVRSDFRNLEESLSECGIGRIDAILYDFGVSSAHYDDSERGFSFREDGPLDMRFDRTGEGKTAADLVAKATERELLEIFRDYGEEPKAYFVAKAIVERRKTTPILTTKDLLSVIEASSFDPKSKVRVFQALRIAVNDEFGSIESSLAQAVKLLAPEGRLAAITFHSLEDRLVKTACKAYERDVPDPVTGRALVEAQLKRVFKKPVEPSEEEIQNNPRSRSAKLRVYEKRS